MKYILSSIHWHCFPWGDANFSIWWKFGFLIAIHPFIQILSTTYPGGLAGYLGHIPFLPPEGPLLEAGWAAATCVIALCPYAASFLYVCCNVKYIYYFREIWPKFWWEKSKIHHVLLLIYIRWCSFWKWRLIIRNSFWKWKMFMKDIFIFLEPCIMLISYHQILAFKDRRLVIRKTCPFAWYTRRKKTLTLPIQLQF